MSCCTTPSPPAATPPPSLQCLPTASVVCAYSTSCPPPRGAASVCQSESRLVHARCAWTWARLVAAGSPSRVPLLTLSRCSMNGGSKDGDAHRLSGEARDADTGAIKGSFSSKELLGQLKRYGVAGFLSYGLLNTFYYLTTFLLVWFYFAPAPGKMGYSAAVERFVKIMAAVWAGSQVTKLLRAGGALALAPLVDKGLTWFTNRFRFESKGKAFAAIAGACFVLAFILFLLLTLLSV